MSHRRQKIWITRAQPGADATAARVRALGHEAFVAPLLTVSLLEGVRIDMEGVGALAFTSANGVRAFAEISPDRTQRVFAVGVSTAEAARAVGFKRVLSADGDVAALSVGIASRRRELTGAVLHPGASELAGDLSGSLRQQGIEVREVALYETVPADLSEADVAHLQAMDAVLLHSPKAATALAKLLKTLPLPDLRALCLSKAVGKPLARSPISAKVFAPFPLEAALLNLIDR
jgi:uroporphyrinogen-III synthase